MGDNKRQKLNNTAMVPLHWHKLVLQVREPVLGFSDNRAILQVENRNV